jgi:queuine tRNA-ribosyltransferase
VWQYQRCRNIQLIPASGPTAELERLNKLEDTVNRGQQLFGINQGAIFKDLRIKHMQRIAELDLPGYAVGGLAVGESTGEMYDTLDALIPHMPKDKPRYLMGVGTPENIIEGVYRGIDFFDCVMPARNGRHGRMYTASGVVNLKNEKYTHDDRPIEEGCGCPVCSRYSRAYLRHLFKAGEILALRFGVLHNLWYYNRLMEEIRLALDEGRFEEFRKAFYEKRAG